MFFLFPESIIQIKMIDSLLIRHHDIRIIRHLLGNKMMPSNRFQPPDFLRIGKGNAVHFISAVLFQEFSQSNNALSCRMNIRKQKAHHILFSNPARNLFSSFLMEYNQRIGSLNKIITGDGFRCGNGNIGTVGSGACPDSIFCQDIGKADVIKRLLRERNLHMGQDCSILLWRILSGNENHLL